MILSLAGALLSKQFVNEGLTGAEGLLRCWLSDCAEFDYFSGGLMKRKSEVLNAVIGVGIGIGLLLGCAPPPEWVKAQRNKVKTKLVSPNAGFKLLSINEFSPTLSITDYDGVIIKWSWHLEEAYAGMIKVFHSCLKERENNQHAELLREIAAACVRETGLPTANETKLMNPNGFTVFLLVIRDSMSPGSGVTLFQSYGGNFGTKIQINRPGISYKQASLDVDHCLDGAAEQGVIQSFSSGTLSDQSGFSTESKSQSIEPFVDRFTDCLNDLGYSTL